MSREMLVPMSQMEAAVRLASTNTAAFSTQLCEEQMLLMLHDTFGFGRERCMRAMRAFEDRMAAWEQSVMQEFDAETFHLRYKGRAAHRAELVWTIDRHDAALAPLVDPEIWRPWRERYKSFGGTGEWCDG